MNAYVGFDALGYNVVMNEYEELNLYNGSSIIALYKKENGNILAQKYCERTLELENLTHEEEEAIRMLIAFNFNKHGVSVFGNYDTDYFESPYNLEVDLNHDS